MPREFNFGTDPGRDQDSGILNNFCHVGHKNIAAKCETYRIRPGFANVVSKRFLSRFFSRAKVYSPSVGRCRFRSVVVRLSSTWIAASVSKWTSVTRRRSSAGNGPFRPGRRRQTRSRRHCAADSSPARSARATSPSAPAETSSCLARRAGTASRLSASSAFWSRTASPPTAPRPGVCQSANQSINQLQQQLLQTTTTTTTMKKALRETQTLRTGCSKVRTPPARHTPTDRTDYNTLRR